MKHLILLLVGASIAAPGVSAEPKLTGAQACQQRCKAADLDGPGVLPYKQKLVQVREQKQGEQSLAKRKELEAEEARAIERRDAFIGRSCSYICTGK